MRHALILASCALLAGCSAPGLGEKYGRLLTPIANPSTVIAAELAFARAAQEKGQWTAFREYATDDAVMFVPEPVDAQSWLREQTDPAQSVKWQPHEVWSSCDGTLAVTKGAWQRPDGSQGYFTTVWQRQGNGDYRWVLDQGDVLAEPLAAPEFVGSGVADCRSDQRVAAPSGRGLAVPGAGGGASRDGSLGYRWHVAADRSRWLTITMIKDGAAVEALRVDVAAPAS